MKLSIKDFFSKCDQNRRKLPYQHSLPPSMKPYKFNNRLLEQLL